MVAFTYTFGSLSGTVPASYLDVNFSQCAFASDLTALTTVVAALPSAATPLIPLAGGTPGSSPTLSKSDHQHPPQQATQNLQTGTTYTLQASDDGKVVDLANAGAITLTLPNSLPVGFACRVCQGGAGQATFTPAGGGSIVNASGFTKTRAQWAVAVVYVRTNGGATAQYVLSGDMA